MLCLALTGFSQRIMKGGMALTKKVNNFQKNIKKRNTKVKNSLLQSTERHLTDLSFI